MASLMNTQSEAVDKICVALGIDPKQCYSLTLRIEMDAIIRMEVGLYPSPDQIDKLADAITELQKPDITIRVLEPKPFTKLKWENIPVKPGHFIHADKPIEVVSK